MVGVTSCLMFRSSCQEVILVVAVEEVALVFLLILAANFWLKRQLRGGILLLHTRVRDGNHESRPPLP